MVEAGGDEAGLAGTAYEGLVDRGRRQAGECVLVTAAAGGVGSAAGQAFAARGGRERLEALNRLVEAGTLRPQTAAVLPLDQARQALEQVAGGHTRGKIVLEIA